MHERWAPVAGFEGRFEVSDFGRVRGPSGRVLKLQLINSGYLMVHLTGAGSRARTVGLVHRLVAAAFLPITGEVVNHLNANKLDNHVSNLEWTTYSGNVRHSQKLGRAKYFKHAVRGVPVAGGEPLYFPSQIAAERAMCGRGSSAVHHCIIGKKRSAYGYVWSRV